jgi:hypothetical protein
MKPYKTVTTKNCNVKIYGNGHEIEMYYKKPDWSEEEELAFKYKDYEYFLREFTNIHNKVYNPNPPEWMKEFDGIKSDSFFSGVLIKLVDDGDAVKAYTYIS